MSLPPEGVIHDIGYRTYEGPRRGLGAIARSLFTTGLLNAYGIGRSGKAKALPMTLLVFMVVPAAIMVAIMVTIGLDDGFIDYSTYANTLQLLIVIFVAAQAPVLFTRDLRSGAIVLYLSRPLSPMVFALVRLASLATAIFVFVMLPVLVLYLGAVSNEADLSDQTGDVLVAGLGIALLALVLATVSALISALTTRRGFAVGAIIVALLVSTGVVATVQAIAEAQGNDGVASVAGVFSPFVLVDGVQAGLFDGTASYQASPDTAGDTTLYLLATVVLLAAAILLLVQRYHRQGRR